MQDQYKSLFILILIVIIQDSLYFLNQLSIDFIKLIKRSCRKYLRNLCFILIMKMKNWFSKIKILILIKNNLLVMRRNAWVKWCRMEYLIKVFMVKVNQMILREVKVMFLHNLVCQVSQVNLRSLINQEKVVQKVQKVL